MHKEPKMYKKREGQITIDEFITPFGRLDQNNRWVKKSKLIPWQRVEERYAALFEGDAGNVAKPVRMAVGALIIKQETGLSDEGVVQAILENPYMQFFIGLYEFTVKAPFASTSMVYFRKRLGGDVMKEINEITFGPQREEKDRDDDSQGGQSGGGNCAQGNVEGEENKGLLLLDATCAPADITYPTDVGLLNEAREKLEGIIDILHPHTGDKHKPRTYRNCARRDFLSFVKKRSKGGKQIRKAIRKQLGYVKRDLMHVDRLLEKTEEGILLKRHMKWLETIRILYQQQETMYQSRSHRIDQRIVSISQPHVRPIVRGKKTANVEFGAKVSISLVNGYAFVDKIGWENYSEADLLEEAVENYKERHGHYPEAVLADKLYRNRKNLNYCKGLGIRLSGPRLGRPPKDVPADPFARQDSAMRNWVESKFGEEKVCYGLDRLFARLQETSECAIHMISFVANLHRALRVLFVRFFKVALSSLVKCLVLEIGGC
jgi:hypothetical protein